MDAAFWHGKWADREIGFHNSAPHPMLVAYLDALGLAPGDRVLLPLCGKTLDIGWLLGRGLRVVGAELSETAVRELFDELGVAPEVSDHGPLRLFQADGLDVWVGDLFDLAADAVGTVDAVYDRAALVALPPETRPRYAAHTTRLADGAPQLVVTFAYDQGQMDGPPFSVPADEVERLYGDAYAIRSLTSETLDLKGTVPAHETAWLLAPPR